MQPGVFGVVLARGRFVLRSQTQQLGLCHSQTSPQVIEFVLRSPSTASFEEITPPEMP